MRRLRKGGVVDELVDRDVISFRSNTVGPVRQGHHLRRDWQDGRLAAGALPATVLTGDKGGRAAALNAARLTEVSLVRIGTWRGWPLAAALLFPLTAPPQVQEKTPQVTTPDEPPLSAENARRVGLFRSA